ncbi:hypothetical protein [Micromonospora sp. NPDC023814]|uniref:hypothetical protein n=1 Tax=Micromonospora sp. NPDC023814 TaxID=3154596 RepID=UPI0033C6ED1B
MTPGSADVTERVGASCGEQPVPGQLFLTYSQSSNPNFPWCGDQTRLYSGKGWDTIK